MTILLYDLVGADPERPFSPHCWKAKMALAHKGLAFETVPTRFTEVAAVEGGLSKTVPAIRDGTRVVADSFAIALYLEDRYPERPTLFGGAGGRAMARFIERWSQHTLHDLLRPLVAGDIHRQLQPADQDHFRPRIEALYQRPIDALLEDRPAAVERLRAGLFPLRSMLSYQPFVGGEQPLFADYIVFGALQWARVMSADALLAPDDPVAAWFERCLDLHGGIGREVAAAA